jgi:hypothetical protein
MKRLLLAILLLGLTFTTAFATVVKKPVYSVTPISGPETGGTTVLIYGNGLRGATAVLFGGVHALSYTVISNKYIRAVTPPGTGIAIIVVKGPSS